MRACTTSSMCSSFSQKGVSVPFIFTQHVCCGVHFHTACLLCCSFPKGMSVPFIFTQQQMAYGSRGGYVRTNGGRNNCLMAAYSLRRLTERLRLPKEINKRLLMGGFNRK